MSGIFQIKMCGQLIGKAPHLAPTHRIRLARERKGPHALSAYPAGQQVTINNRIDLIRTTTRLIDALRI